MEDRLELHNESLEAHKGLLEAQTHTLEVISSTLASIASDVRSFTLVWQTAKGMRSFIVWASPVVLLALAAWHFLKGLGI